MRKIKQTLAMAGLLVTVAPAYSQCRLYLANQLVSNQGLTLSLEGQPDSTNVCPLSSVTLKLAVGDGTAVQHVQKTQSWQTGVVYTAKAVITATGPQQLLN